MLRDISEPIFGNIEFIYIALGMTHYISVGRKHDIEYAVGTYRGAVARLYAYTVEIVPVVAVETGPGGKPQQSVTILNSSTDYGA